MGSELKRLAKRQIDCAARYGGEEFAMILLETGAAGGRTTCGVGGGGNRCSQVAAPFITSCPVPDGQRGCRDSNAGMA